MRLLSKRVLSAFLNFIYPSTCLHCSNPISFDRGYFCKACSSQLELINPQERCPRCFGSDYDIAKRVCYTCMMCEPILKKCAAAFDYQGPAATLVLKMKYANQPYLAKGAGAYLAMQGLNLNWPLPDLIVPVPLTLVHRISRGYNQSLLLAQVVGKILERPVQEILQRSWFDHSQAGMSKNQRLQLDENTFSLKRNVNIQDKIIWLVDDVMTSGQTMNCCTQVLYNVFPKEVYGLVFCRAC